jgi:hypothetical protein
MTRSREDDRKRAARNATRDRPDPTPIRLDQLCIVRGCLNRRRGLNLCDDCQEMTDPR